MSILYKVNEDPALPDSFQDFEKAAGRLVGAECKVTMMRPHKRHGQAQQGVDYYGCDASGAWIGVQAKLRSGSRVLSWPDVKDEIEKAERFEPKLSRYFIATSAPFNARLHKFVEFRSRRRVKRGRFSVHIFFREDLQHLLSKYPHVLSEPRGGVFVLNCG
jgi:hypothetical protein